MACRTRRFGAAAWLSGAAAWLSGVQAVQADRVSSGVFAQAHADIHAHRPARWQGGVRGGTGATGGQGGHGTVAGGGKRGSRRAPSASMRMPPIRGTWAPAFRWRLRFGWSCPAAPQPASAGPHDAPQPGGASGGGVSRSCCGGAGGAWGGCGGPPRIGHGPGAGCAAGVEPQQACSGHGEGPQHRAPWWGGPPLRPRPLLAGECT